MRDPALDVFFEDGADRAPGVGEPDGDDSGIVVGRRPLDEAASRCAIDQPRDRRAVEPEAIGDLGHARGAIPKDPEHAQLGHRQLPARGDPGQLFVDGEGELRGRVGQREGHVQKST
ncbi:hypothetical protein GCM10025867_19980 [Frondihabitans sucicola]|uniref:Uncharacterized protein n=1 Tax=Frondihabitans sucicola TaxID=1268041 RepID=A0ABM8GMW3_9MICO|nr:hypothetical protein GCM10025867_19980 [Frondihabitans sucicola]